jgi:beta-lactamase regulating signal transducer with metallopeptidase domain
VVHSLWQGTLLAILLSVLMMILEKRSAQLRYEVACGAMFTMLMMALATFIIYLDQDPNTVDVTVALMGNNFNSSLTIVNGETSFLQTNFQAVISFFDAQLPLIVNIWLIGFLFFAFRMTGGLIHLRQLRHQDNFPVDKMLQDKLNQLIRRSPLQRSVKVMESALIKVPILLGHLKPLILIPIGTINLLTEEEVEAVLAHELAHIIRRDFSMNIFFTLIEILFYYHPGVWLMAATIRSEREHCCDDLALFLCKNPLAYARALYKLEAAHKTTRLPGLALSFSSQKNQLLHRVRRILNQPQNKSNIMEKLMATTFLLLTVAILSVGATTPLDKAKANRVISTSVESLSHPVVYVEASRLPAIKVLPRIVLDTIPVKRRDRRKIIKTENGRAIEITMEDGQISNLKIDGKEISADQYDQHEKLIQDLVVEFENIPTPPTPPQLTDIPVPPAAPKAPAPPTKVKEVIVNGEKRIITYEKDSEMIIGDDEEIMEIQEEVEIEMEMLQEKMEEHHKEMEKHHKKMEEQREEIMEAHREKMEAHQEKMNAHREKMEVKRIELEERMEEIHESHDAANKIIATDIGHSSNEINNAIVDQLIADGLIDSRENYKFELSGQKFKVNRKTQPDAIHQKYKQLYEELSGSPLSNKSKIKVAKSKF